MSRLMQSTYHECEDIEWAAVRFSCVRTDNRDALIALGFQPMYPNAGSEYEKHIWARSVDCQPKTASANHLRYRIIQRAFLDESVQ